MPFTFHTHSGQFCRHAKGSLEDVVKAALSQKMLVLGLSEHVPRSRAEDLYPEEAGMTTSDLHQAFGDYVSEARRLREKYGDQIEILIGAETELITDATPAELKALREQYKLDYFVGSVHHIDGMAMDFSQELYDKIVERFGGDRAAMFRRYFDQQLVLLQTIQPEIVGHFDLVRIFHPYSQGVADPMAQAEIRSLASRNIDYAIAYGAIFEINSRAWKKGLRDAYPQRDVLREILQKGGRVTISDDSHSAQDVGMYYDRLHAYLVEMGLRDLHYLRRAKGGRDTNNRIEACLLKNAVEHRFWTANGYASVGGGNAVEQPQDGQSRSDDSERQGRRSSHRRSNTDSSVPATSAPKKDKTDVRADTSRRLSIGEGVVYSGAQIGKRRSITYAEAGMAARRRSLAYSDLMAVFYPPNTMSQPTVTDLPFESRAWEGVDDRQLEQMPIVEPGAAASWEPTLERAIKSIVSIKAQCVRSFDTETSGTYTATGFVVDAEAGLILSNRHVVNPAPIVAQAIFVNYEEVELQPVYRDPVHDFGLFRYDTKHLRFMQPESIHLAPHKAKVGMEIRVVGNDAGEKLSILAGTLARLDRPAPDYGIGQYNDFNTFYLQAASGTSGGSSGSPVLDIYGDAVALNAGGSSKAASSFYLPLNRIVRAVDLVRRGEHVQRGTIQTEFEYLSYDELRRLGLDMTIETKMRETFPASQGMLAVRSALPKGPADGSLRAGDIVVAVNGQPVIDFVALEDVFDASVGRDMHVSVWRGAKAYSTRIGVQDLHAITPSRYIEIGGGVVNEVSYQVARSYGIPVGGIYVASSGHTLGSASVWRGSVIQSIGGESTPDLDSFARAVSGLRECSRVPVKFFALDQPYKPKVMIMSVSTHWHAFRLAERDAVTGLWRYTELSEPMPPESTVKAQLASAWQLPASLAPGDKVWPSVVLIDFHIPYLVDGMKSTHFLGPGFIIDKRRGLVVCDRDTVPISVGDVYITVAGSIVLLGSVDFLHPVYNFAIVRYDPRQIGATPVEDVRLHPDYLSGERKLEQGDSVHVVAVSADQSPVVRRTRVSSRAMVSTKECLPPRFRCLNVEGLKLNDQPSCQGGVLCDADGLVTGLWTSVSSQDANNKDVTTMTGFDISILRETMRSVSTASRYPDIYSLDVELWTIRMAAARTLGLSTARIDQIEAQSNSTNRLLYVLGMLTTNTPAAALLRTGDIILEKNDCLVRDVDQIGIIHGAENVDLVVLRDGKEVRLSVPTTRLDPVETKHVVHWSGALVQEPYRAVQEQVRALPSSIYVSCTLYGSPANCYGLRPGMWITEVESIPVKSIADFIHTLKRIRQTKDAEDASTGGSGSGSGSSSSTSRYVRLTVVNRNEITRMLSLRLDSHYWPPWELVIDPTAIAGWRSIRYL
ncbi:hypothetical protein LPJ59_000957 [Coemansia sp. RSA 2399]|nr:hypothetical protein LPJ59_000957 [Coemansia sp. RSA 2399]